jgi:hypothetical protein
MSISRAGGLSLVLVLASCAGGPGSDAELTVTVAAGDHARIAVPVSFVLPRAPESGGLALVDEAGEVLPVQRYGDLEATVVVRELAAGESRSYRLVSGREAETAVIAARRNGAVELAVGDRTVLRYNHRETELPRAEIDSVFRRGGYIHPVITPSGRVITGDYPADHIHHHGIWAAWTSAVFEGRRPDFWNMGQRRGTVRPVALDSVWSGPVHGGFSARHQYVDLTDGSPREALNESWTVRVYPGRAGEGSYHLFDLEMVHTTASASPLTLPEYHYGGLGFRGRDEWTGEEHTYFLTSEGRDRSDGHATRARWAHIGGYVDGELAGVAILAHPDNFRFPEPMRIHPNEPFFNWAPSQGGEWAIEPGRPFVARYRFVVADGAPDPTVLDRLWNDLAHPPEVNVTSR